MSLYHGVYIDACCPLAGDLQNYTADPKEYYRKNRQNPSKMALLASGYILMGSINVAESNAWSYAEYEILGDAEQRVFHTGACNILSGCEK